MMGMLSLRIIFLCISKNLPIFPSEALQIQKKKKSITNIHVVIKTVVYFIPANKKYTRTWTIW